jgi:hypothetical protein
MTVQPSTRKYKEEMKQLRRNVRKRSRKRMRRMRRVGFNFQTF